MSLRRAILSAVASALLIVVLPLAAHAQQGTIRGTVTAEASGEPLAGARISVIGSNRFAQSAADGTYELTEVRAGQVQLRVAIIGYQSQAATLSVTAGQTATLDFTLPAAVFTLDAVVVTAVGEQSQREVANAISAVDASKIQEAAPQTTLGELLQGKAPGVTIRQSSGTTGVGQSIKIRGNSSLNLGNTPLIYVDGARIDNDDTEGPGIGGQQATRLNDINPEDIERIEVVKGPSASTLYGTEAAAGVIQIFTKKGRRGAPEFGFRSDFGANIKSPHTFAPSLWNPSVLGLGGAGAFDTVYAMNLLEDYDPFGRGFIQTYAGSVRGGTDDLTYYVSGEYQDEEGTLPNNQFQRYYARGNFTITPNPTWDLQASGGYTSNFLTLPDNDNNGFGYIGVAQIGSPWLDWITASDPNTGGAAILTCPRALEQARTSAGAETLVETTAIRCNLDGEMPPGFGSRRFSDVQSLVNVQDVERFTGSATLRVRPTSFWTNRFTLGYDLVDQRTAFLVPVNPDLPFGSASLGARGLDTQTNRNVTVDYSGSLNFGFGDLGTVTSFGFQWYRTVGETSGCDGDEFPGGATTCSDAVVTSGNEAFNESKTLGLYVQEQLSYKDRLFVTPAVRFDDNSAFGQNFNIQTYPKIGVSFIAIDQPVSVIDQLKLRGSWGRSGKAPTNTASLTTFNSRGFTVFQQDVLGVTPAQPGNLDLAPEIGEEFEVGVDVGLIDNRVGLEATYYNQRTKDVLVQRPLAPSIGFPNAVWDNLGRMDNQGVEFGLNVAAVTNPSFRWDWTVNFATNSNEIKELDLPIIYGLGGASQRHQQGYAFGSYFSERIIVDADGNAMVDFDLNGDGTVDQADVDLDLEDGVEDQHVLLGQPTPKWEGSVSTTLNLFRYLTLYAFLDFKGGHQLFNSTEEFRCGFSFICPEVHQEEANGDLTERATVARFAVAQGSESPWIEDADFAKLRTVSLKFQFPDGWASALRVKRASLTFSGQNLATFTGYSGADPEINFAGQSNATFAEFLTLPTQRRFLTTLSVTF